MSLRPFALKVVTFNFFLLLVIMTGKVVASPTDAPSYYLSNTPALAVNFANNTNSEQATSNIWINLVGGGLPTDPSNSATLAADTQSIGYYYDNTGTAQYLYTNTSLNLSSISSSATNNQPEIFLFGWGSGRLYVSYGSGFTGLSSSYTPSTGPYAGWQPAPGSPDANFEIRHQAMELTVTPEANSTQTAWTAVNQMYADLSYIDYASISLGMTVSNPTAGAKNTTQTTSIGSTLVNAVASTLTVPQYTPNSNILTNGGSIIQVAGQSTNPAPPAAGSYQNATNFNAPNGPLPSSNFLRVASPGSMGTTGSSNGPTAFYHDWSRYMSALQTGGSLNSAGALVTTIAGVNASTTYNMIATFNAGTINIGGTDYTGYVHMTGTIGGSAATIDIPYSEMEKSTGVYGENPQYSINGGPLQAEGNTIQTWVTGDLLTGMNFGFVGSTTPVDSTTLGALTSTQWWAAANDDMSITFAGAQSDVEFYNTYAAELQNVTSGYAFAYEDRLGQNTTNYTVDGDSPPVTGPVLNVGVNPDFASVPEPSSILLFMGGAAGLFIFRKRGK
ncbi:MAG: beta-1,3-glucanase family protein, partial [Chthoniobacterales bacterium]